MSVKETAIEEVMLQGTPLCHGIAIGPPFCLERDDVEVAERLLPASGAQQEIERYRGALLRSRQDIQALQKRLERDASPEGVLILEIQLEMLRDPLLTLEIEKEIREGHKNVEFIFKNAVLRCQERFQSLKDTFFVERFQDLQDIAHRILRYLQERKEVSVNDVPKGSIVCAKELIATDAASASYGRVAAFITETGGSATHAAILAKGKGIPYVTNVSLKEIRERKPSLIIVDGFTGKVILSPSTQTLSHYEAMRKKGVEISSPQPVVHGPAQTKDGYSVCLHANVDLHDDLPLVHACGAQGVGLFRSEYILLSRSHFPSEDEQVEIYSALIKGMQGLPLVIRTFDLGGDKAFCTPPAWHSQLSGQKGRMTRLFLREKALLKTQIRAILRASSQDDGHVSLLFPMIATLCEWRDARVCMREAREELGLSHPLRMGCMIEVPSAALMADHLARECDFLSIGTNDLIHHALAIDRANHALNALYEPADPGVMRLMRWVTRAACKARIPVSVCGDMASDPTFTPLLLGLGVKELSVPPRSLPLIGETIRKTCITDAVNLAEQVLKASTAHEVRTLVSTPEK